MEPELQHRPSEPESAMHSREARNPLGSPAPAPPPQQPPGPIRIFIGNGGLRAGWSLLIAMLLYRIIRIFLGSLTVATYPAIVDMDFSPARAIIEESIPFLAMLAAGLVIARIEKRKLLDFNLTGPRRLKHFISGLGAGFVALSALVAALALGGWLHFGPIALTGDQIFVFGALWAIAFLLVGCVEEGIFRCYLQSALTRGINFWWALGIIAVLCLDLVFRARGGIGIIALFWPGGMPAVGGNCEWGVYAIALLGFVPCFLLHAGKIEGSTFWQAAWVTSTAFGFFHTGNAGENWIGIFAAAFIGFVFCVSVRVTGSAWWAIGCHAAWDWGETFFYGTADSGLMTKGHFLTTTLNGNPLWSGGADGPEGSLLALGVVLLLLAVLLAVYGRKKPAPQAVAATELLAG
jgi:hypothetical protein